MDAVQELLSQEPMLADLIQCLKAFPRDPDCACLGITAASQGTARSLHTGIQSLLWLRYGPSYADSRLWVHPPARCQNTKTHLSAMARVCLCQGMLCLHEPPCSRPWDAICRGSDIGVPSF